jgi:hypothetical protein
MWSRFFSVAVTAAVALAITTQVTRANDEVHEGKVVSVSDGKITVLDKRDGENDTFVVTTETKISRNGKPAKLSDVQAGDMAKIIATSQGEKLIAKQIVAVAPE